MSEITPIEQTGHGTKEYPPQIHSNSVGHEVKKKDVSPINNEESEKSAQSQASVLELRARLKLAEEKLQFSENRQKPEIAVKDDDILVRKAVERGRMDKRRINEKRNRPPSMLLNILTFGIAWRRYRKKLNKLAFQNQEQPPQQTPLQSPDDKLAA